MKRSVVLMLWLVLLAMPVGGTWGQEKKEESPSERKAAFTAVTDFILKQEYPEVFKDKPYKLRLRGFTTADVDEDGTLEAFLHFEPHYLQSPTVLIYQVGPDGRVARVKEGLAPGVLEAVTFDFIDSHTVGAGVDFVPQKKDGNPFSDEVREIMAREMIKSQARLVAYRHFFHMDTPQKFGGSFLDMTHLPPYDDSQDDKAFQFSKVKGLTVGRLRAGGKPNVVVAWTEGHLTYYRIDAIRSDGLLNKQVWVREAPPGLKAVFVTEEGLLGYQDTEERGVEIPLPE